MRRGLARLLVAVTAAGLMVPATTAQPLPPGSGLLLPVQDRSGDPQTLQIIAETLRENLAGRGQAVDPDHLRVFLRHLRIRDLESASPASVERLAEELGVGWFLAPVVHESIAGPMARITLSGSLYRAGRRDLWWTDFSASSGLERLPWLGRGRIDNVGALARGLAEQMAGSLAAPVAAEIGGGKAGRSEAVEGPVVVLPFNAATDNWGAVASETATRAAQAAFHRRGARVVFPGLVEEVQRQVGTIWRGQLDDLLCEALRLRSGASWVFTGTVEILEPGAGEEPEPRVALSARLIDTGSNAILWIGGGDRLGWDRQRLFRAGRVYSSGQLMTEIMEDLVDEALSAVAAVERNS